VFDVSHDQSRGTDVMFVTMELLAGRTLREAIYKDGPMSLPDALPIARQIADGLSAAHRAGVIHRDLKSANVMLVPEEGQSVPRVVVTDFGLARASIFSERTITNTGDILGSPAYMSPEQIEGKPLTPATDIFAFGVLLYEMITRGHPFEADTPLASVLKRLREPATSPRHYLDLDLTWEHVILRCLERQPEDRYPTRAM
jgi:serine/threonine protein kinase